MIFFASLSAILLLTKHHSYLRYVFDKLILSWELPSCPSWLAGFYSLGLKLSVKFSKMTALMPSPPVTFSEPPPHSTGHN